MHDVQGRYCWTTVNGERLLRRVPRGETCHLKTSAVKTGVQFCSPDTREEDFRMYGGPAPQPETIDWLDELGARYTINDIGFVLHPDDFQRVMQRMVIDS
ncbi:MAG: hypothetical protein KDA61_03955 [Planctomycetales bacterium]|nr:hypothetical protein [Planctomycetales bacterium]